MSHAPDRVDDATLADLRRRLAATRPARLPAGAGWELGTNPEYLADLVGYWATVYDWRAHEDRIRRLPWVATVADGFAARSIHQRTRGAGASAVVLLHGWPDSILRFERVLPMLDDVDLVVPCLPGYPFAEPLTAPGMSTNAMAEVVAGVMHELGYTRYVVSGGDVGSRVAQALAFRHPDRVRALHLTDVPAWRGDAPVSAELSDAEQAYLTRTRRWQRDEGAYMHQHSTKPGTLAPALADSPAGLASWIVEKLRAWSDCGGDVESAFPREDLLTWVTAYWVTETIGTSFSPYHEPRDPVGYVSVPTAFSQFPADIAPAPRAFAERFFAVGHWDEQPSGGHFAAWERPDAFVAGLREAIALG